MSALLRRVQATSRRRSFARFLADATPGYEYNFHHSIICNAFERLSAAVARKEEPRLIVTIPPRHIKSQTGSRCFPAWHLGHHPDHEFIIGSAAMALTTQFSVDCRNIVTSQMYRDTFPEVELDKAARGKQSWRTTQGGGYKAAGVGSQLPGYGGHIVGLDDTIKGIEQAYNPAAKDKAWLWFTGDVENRLAPGGGMYMLNTRWAKDDLVGRVLDRDGTLDEGGIWEVISMPAIATEDDEYRKKGDALHPSRFPADCMVFRNARMNPKIWASLFQQQPTVDGGEIFQRDWFESTFFHHQQLPPRFQRLILSVDCNFRATKSGSFACAQIWGLHGRDLYLLDQRRGRWAFTRMVEENVRLCRKWKPHKKYIEGKANGDALISSLRTEPDLARGIEITNPASDKQVRAVAASLHAESGRIHLPAPGQMQYPWAKGVLDELVDFPGGTNDDQVDCLTQVVTESLGGGAGYLQRMLYG